MLMLPIADAGRSQKLTAILKVFLVPAILLLLYSPCNAQWGPETIEVTCISEECLSLEKRDQIEKYAREILGKLKNMGFKPPATTSEGNRMGNFIAGRDGSMVIQMIYNADNASGFASALSPCSQKGEFLDKNGRITLGPKINIFPPHIIYWFLAHEMFHTLQHSQPVFMQASTCGMPLWLGEGTANAIGLKLMQDHFGVNGFRPALSSDAGPSVYGARAYYIGLTANAGATSYQHTPAHKNMGYRTSSFWRYIADRYYGGKTNYLAHWMNNAMVGGDDWLKWVDQQLLKDQKIQTKLYMVFPDFQANFATWVPEKYDHLKQEEWLMVAYDKCLEVNLSPGHASQQLSFGLEPISARCIRVRASGISSSNVASIKILAEDKDKQNLDNLHLGGAILSAKVRSSGTDFNCYRETKNAGQLPGCLDKPFSGEHRGPYTENAAKTRLVKTWLNKPQIPESGMVDNLYVISYSPLEPRDSIHSHRTPQKVELTIGLDLTKLSGSVKGKAKKASSMVNLKSGSPVPMQGSEDPAHIASEDKVSKSAYHISKNSASNMRITDKGILSISITDRALASDSEAELKGGISFTINPYDLRIPYGSTGKFPAKLTTAFEIKRVIDPNSIIVMVPEEQVMGSINVVEFSEQLLHLELAGNFCRMGDLDKKTGKCKKIETVEATIIKPFGWAYDGAQDFVSIDSPGMAEYRRVLSSGLSMSGGMPFPMPDIPGMPQDLMSFGEGSSGGGMSDCVHLPEGVSKEGYSSDIIFCSVEAETASSNAGVETFTLSDPAEANCSCSCAEMKEVTSLSDQITNVAETADGRPDMTTLKLEKLTCIFQCAQEYAACK